MAAPATGRARVALGRSVLLVCLSTLILFGAVGALPALAGDGAARHSVPLSSWTWTLTNPAGFGVCLPQFGCDNVRVNTLAAYGERLLAGTANASLGAEIWAYDGATWTLQVSGGMDDMQNSAVVSMAPFAGRLYAGTQQDESSGAEVWAYDGTAWTRALSGGFDPSALPSEPKNIAAASLAAFGSQLYIGTRYDYRGAQIWAYDGVTVTQVVSSGLANSGNVAVSSLAVFGTSLYAGTINRSGSEIWRSSNGVQWTRAVTSGSIGANNIAIPALTVMSNTLYAATENEVTGAEIWASSNGQAWLPVLTGGLGNGALFRVNDLVVYKGMLYAGVTHQTLPLAEVWAYDGQVWQRVVSSSLPSGGQAHAFYESRALAVYGDALYLGTSEEYAGGSIVSPGVWSSSGPLAQTPTATRTATATMTRTATPTATASLPPATATATATVPTATATVTPTTTSSPTPPTTATATPTNGGVYLFLPFIIR